MPHPQMYDDADPVLSRVRALALAFPCAEVKVSHGRPAFFTKKIFVYYGGSVKVDGVYVQHEQCVMVMLPEDERLAMEQDPRTFVPAYMGAYGWLGIDLPSADELEGWDEVGEWLDASYRITAPKKLIAELDERT
ncbi:MmcQ/YjbR family DNA-binding protein [Nocardioides salsibiostraticola]